MALFQDNILLNRLCANGTIELYLFKYVCCFLIFTYAEFNFCLHVVEIRLIIFLFLAGLSTLYRYILVFLIFCLVASVIGLYGILYRYIQVSLYFAITFLFEEEHDDEQNLLLKRLLSISLKHIIFEHSSQYRTSFSYINA